MSDSTQTSTPAAPARFDPATVLGVEPGTTGKDLTDAYRRAAATAHPDRNGGDSTAFTDVNLAYKALQNEPRAVKEVALRNGGREELAAQAAAGYAAAAQTETDRKTAATQARAAKVRSAGQKQYAGTDLPPRSTYQTWPTAGHRD